MVIHPSFSVTPLGENRLIKEGNTEHLNDDALAEETRLPSPPTLYETKPRTVIGYRSRPVSRQGAISPIG